MEYKLVNSQTEWPPNGHTPDLTITPLLSQLATLFLCCEDMVLTFIETSNPQACA